ncbi:hypothetical protein [Fischerella sp. PCC 9605]|nr:hypothetical protein [Fischerella sp. PCC 9605]
MSDEGMLLNLRLETSVVGKTSAKQGASTSQTTLVETSECVG